ncbi:MAG TPA: thioredoxin family protein [Longimicrobiales bacterium]|nr:thioredoxin family protein [Longimicrobiales bacterium]
MTPRSLRRIALGLLPALTVVLPACAQEPGATAGDLWAQGVPFSTFLAEADRRVETWEGNWDRGREISAETLAAGRAIPGSWRLLVVAEDYCGDSANTVPYVARLAEALDNLEVRIVDSSEGRGVMEAYRTPDGRGATPTMVLLDASGAEAGCLVEQPQPLQQWWLGDARDVDEDERFERKYAWYDEDAGASTTAEVVEMMAGAAAGTPVCRAGGAARS